MQNKRLIKIVPSIANEFVRIASGCSFEIDVANRRRSSYAVDAKSLVGVLGLDFAEPISVSYYGSDEELEAFLAKYAFEA